MAVTPIPSLVDILTPDQTVPIPKLDAATGATVPQDDVHQDGLGVFFTTRGGKAFLLDGTPYNPVPIPQKAVAPVLSYDQQMALATAPRSSSSFSTSQSFQDPAALAEQKRVNDATIARWTQQDALAEQQQRYLERKDAWAQANNDSRLQLDTQGQLATIKQQRDQLNFQIQNAQQQAAQAQQAMEQRNNEFNATQKLATDTANAQFADRAATRLQQVNSDIGTLGADAGDRGKWASFVTANSGWGADNTGLPGTNLITADSARPLEHSLATRNALMTQNNAPFMFNPIASPTAGPLSAADIVSRATRAGWTPTPGQEGQYNIDSADRFLKGNAAQPVQAATAANPGMVPPAPSMGAARVEANGRMDAAGVPSFVPRFEDGGASVDQDMLMTIAAILGMEPKAVAGEKGKANGETVMSNGDVVVIPDKGKLASKQKKMATGGLNLAGSPLSMDFLQTASTKARSGTPWSGGGVLPTPVYESSPGTDPGFAAILDSVRALEQGVPVDYSQRLTQKYRPVAAGERLVGRSA